MVSAVITQICHVAWKQPWTHSIKNEHACITWFINSDRLPLSCGPNLSTSVSDNTVFKSSKQTTNEQLVMKLNSAPVRKDITLLVLDNELRKHRHFKISSETEIGSWQKKGKVSGLRTDTAAQVFKGPSPCSFGLPHRLVYLLSKNETMKMDKWYKISTCN
jgi:hypothetical protein